MQAISSAALVLAINAVANNAPSHSESFIASNIAPMPLTFDMHSHASSPTPFLRVVIEPEIFIDDADLFRSFVSRFDSVFTATSSKPDSRATGIGEEDDDPAVHFFEPVKITFGKRKA